MKKSHIVFGVICASWITILLISPHTEELRESQSIGQTLGQIIGSLILPSIFYGIYLIIESVVRKGKDKSKSNP